MNTLPNKTWSCTHYFFSPFGNNTYRGLCQSSRSGRCSCFALQRANYQRKEGAKDTGASALESSNKVSASILLAYENTLSFVVKSS